ncbi:MAG TPA: hypothetical protein VGP44_04305 [Gemmatimonadales bacterium]|nr:hypothetical protein [Gemmatimonadales bacterium]
MGRVLLLLLALAACDRRPKSDPPAFTSVRDSTDSAFALLQTRGHVGMGVDQYTSYHRFESLPDGGRISLQRDAGDTAGVAQIRAHMRRIKAAFSRGDFALPGLVHARDVPGTAVMAARRSRISYVTDTLPGGGELRLRTSDPSAIDAIHQFLAFQRQDHRSTSYGAGH